jgi:toxin YxiD
MVPYLVKPVGVNPGHSYPAGITSFNAKKAYRTEVATANYSTHGFKHLQASTEAEAKTFSSGGPAQYLPEINNNGLEKIALEKGFIIEHGGGYYSYIQFDRPIGYNNGRATSWIRAELSGGSYHGHPVLESQVPETAKEFFTH